MYAAMAQLVEHILGKDEVPGPNPGSSSKHPRNSFEFRGFGFLWGFIKICRKLIEFSMKSWYTVYGKVIITGEIYVCCKKRKNNS